MLRFVEIAQRLRPRWVLWENVPGVLSSSGGRDFGSFLGALEQLGYGWAYRVLDAQYVRTHRHPRAVPQRRRRVFVVGCLGDWRGAAAVLLERQSVRRDSAARGKAREGASADVASSLGARGVRSHIELDGHGAYIPEICGALSDGAHMGGGLNGQDAYTGRIIAPFNLAPGVGPRKHDLHVTAADVSKTIDAFGSNPATHQGGAAVVAFRKAKRAQSVTDDESWVEAETSPTINAFDTGERDTHAVAMRNSGVGYWVEDTVAGTIDANMGQSGHATRPDVIAQRDTHAVAFQSNLGTRGGDVFTDGSSPTVRVRSSSGGSPPAVAAFSITPASGQGADLQATETDVASGISAVTLGNGTDRGIRVVSSPVHGPDVHAISACLTSSNDPSRSPQSAEVTNQVAAVYAASATVRRLTPRECERLQGFPDDWTAIPWRGRAAEDCPDGPRYRALGNSMAVNCMEWIGQRIADVEARVSASADEVPA